MWGLQKGQTSRAVMILLSLALGGCAVLGYLYFARSPDKVYVREMGATQYVPVPVRVQGKEIRVPIPVEVKKIEIVPVEVVREKMKWPELQDNTVLAVGEVGPHRGKTSVVAVGAMDNDVLRTRLVMRQEPIPFFGLEKSLRFGAYAGTGGTFQAEIAATPLRLGPVYVSGKVQGTWGDGVNDVRAFVGVEVQFGF